MEGASEEGAARAAAVAAKGEDDADSARRMTPALVQSRVVPAAVAKSGDEAAIARASFAATRLYLDRMRFRNIDHLELHDRATHLYLQHNLIERVENLEDLRSLRFLSLAGNRLTAADGLGALPLLSFVDLSDNRIAGSPEAVAAALPRSLVAVRLRGNPVAAEPGYRRALAAALPSLRLLDDEPAAAGEA